MRLLYAPIAIGIAAVAAIASGDTALPDKVKNALTLIDAVPSKEQIDFAFGNSPTVALATLADMALARDESANVDIGIRLRAVHALANYCAVRTSCVTTDLAHQSLTTLIADASSARSGTPVLLLRAAVETLGPMRVNSDVNLLVPLLEHPSRDIRASTARALQDLCNTQAITPLRVRYSRETTEQVTLAISEALRILGQCSGSP
jgi:HEAT repeat protein